MVLGPKRLSTTALVSTLLQHVGQSCTTVLCYVLPGSWLVKTTAVVRNR